MEGRWDTGRPRRLSAYKAASFTAVRRHISEPWLKLMGRVGQAGSETFVIGSGPTEYQAKSNGELFLYVNDAVFGLPGRYWALPYFWSSGKNKGTGTVTVSSVPQ